VLGHHLFAAFNPGRDDILPGHGLRQISHGAKVILSARGSIMGMGKLTIVEIENGLLFDFAVGRKEGGSAENYGHEGKKISACLRQASSASS
jgi:hypothetical protein